MIQAFCDKKVDFLLKVYFLILYSDKILLIKMLLVIYFVFIFCTVTNTVKESSFLTSCDVFPKYVSCINVSLQNFSLEQKKNFLKKEMKNMFLMEKIQILLIAIYFKNA